MLILLSSNPAPADVTAGMSSTFPSLSLSFSSLCEAGQDSEGAEPKK